MSPRRRSTEASAALRAELVEAARRVVERDGPAAVTMRSVAREAGCALGLPYKVFTDRTELVAEVIGAEFRRLLGDFDAFVASAGTATVGENLDRWARLLLDSPSIALAGEAASNPRLGAAVDAAAGTTGVVRALESSVVGYLAAEQRLGRIAPGVDVAAFGFLIAGAVHNLVASGQVYPRPSDAGLAAVMRAVAEGLAPPEVS